LDRKIIEKKGKGRKRRFKPFIEYKWKNLLDKKVFLEEFLPEYSPYISGYLTKFPLFTDR